MSRDRFDLRHGDSRDELKLLGSAHVDALVTDPPAGIKFMGVGWDSFADRKGDNGHDRSIVFDKVGGNHNPINNADKVRTLRSEGARFRAAVTPIFAECLRVLKPGAHGLVWALPRTSHWTATALEEAGFEIRDRISHLFGTGFPKSLNLDGGLGTALKPACEDWWLVRKPLDGTVAANVTKWGTGALNIDGCRIEGTPRTTHSDGSRTTGRGMWTGEGGGLRATECVVPAGRWPANVTLDEEAAALLDEQIGELVSGALAPYREQHDNVTSYRLQREKSYTADGNSGGASRFFYVAKPDRAERDIGCEDLPAASGGEATARQDGTAGLQNPRAGAGRNGGARNIHPTVKSIDLMRWLCRLIAPRGGLVLDPFMGSGSTGVACSREGMRFIGIERERAYFEIARRRLVGDAPLLNRFVKEVPESASG